MNGELTVRDSIALRYDPSRRASRAMNLLDGLFEYDKITGKAYADPPLTRSELQFARKVLGMPISEVPALVDSVCGRGTYRKVQNR